MEAAPQVIAEKITHRLIDGEKEESFAVRLSRAGDEENHGDKKIAKGDDRLSDGTKDEKKNPPLYGGGGERGGRGYLVRRYPIACKQAARPQGSRRSMLALFPRTGKSSGALRCLSLQATFI